MSVVLGLVAMTAALLGSIPGGPNVSTYLFPRQGGNAARAEKALLCITAIGRRDPVSDADHDAARGDLTPIGITFTPHNPPDPSTRYRGACAKGYADSYRPTGKWFGYASHSAPIGGTTMEEDQCRTAAVEYARRYNRRMVEHAPAAVRKFCESQRLDDDERLGLATTAIFGDAIRRGGYVRGSVPNTIDGTAYLTRPYWLVGTDQGPALVTMSVRRDAPECLEMTECADTIGVAYLTETGQRMTRRGAWPSVLRVNRDAWQGAGLSCCGPQRRTRHAELTVRQTMRRAGCRVTRETLIELTPAGPVMRGVIPIDVNDPARAARGEVLGGGRLENVSVGKSFDVIVPGTAIREHYKFDGVRFVGPRNSVYSCP